MRRLSLLIIILLTIQIGCSRQQWIETTQQDFADGTFDGGGNLYASWKGDVQVVNSWDLNNDGWMDLVFTNWGNDDSYNIESHIYWGSTDGFSIKNRTGLPTYGSIAHTCADLNNDSYMDLVFTSWLKEGLNMDSKKRQFDSHAYIYWGDKAGFDAQRYSTLPTLGATGATIADLNNDGYLDLIIASGYYEGEYKPGITKQISKCFIYWGGKDGFSEKNRLELKEFSHFGSLLITSADLNKDGFLDLIAGNLEENSYSYIVYGGREGFKFDEKIALRTSAVRSIKPVDSNGDGYLDIVLAHRSPVENDKQIKSLIYWGSSGSYSDENRLEIPTLVCMDVSIADINQDGNLDLVYANYMDEKSTKVPSYIYWGSADGFNISKRAELQTMGGHSCYVADFNGDGFVDIAFANAGDGDTVSIDSYLYYGSPDGFTLSEVTFPTHDGHHNTFRDLGNIYDRNYRDIYLSSVFDAGKEVEWKRVNWQAEEPKDCSVDLEIKTGNAKFADSSWSGWMKVSNNEKILGASKSKYIQYRAIFCYDGKGRPRLNEVRIDYIE